MKRTGLVLYALVLSVFMYEPVAHAYIDPNTGGVIFQVLMPILAVLIGFIAFAWNFVKKQTMLLVHAVWKCMILLASFFKQKGRN